MPRVGVRMMGVVLVVLDDGFANGAGDGSGCYRLGVRVGKNKTYWFPFLIKYK